METSKETRTQQVGLGCGTLIVIALIVFFLGNRGTDDVKNEVRGLRTEFGKLQEAVDLQTVQSSQAMRKVSDLPVDELKREVEQLHLEIRELRKAIEAQASPMSEAQAAPGGVAP
jgi:hypothetical protein